MYTPGSWLFQYSPVKGRSVPLLTQTSYCNGVSCCLSLALSNFSTTMNALSDALRFWLDSDRPPRDSKSHMHLPYLRPVVEGDSLRATAREPSTGSTAESF